MSTRTTKFTGADLARWRDERGLTAIDVQERIGIHRNTQRNWERDDAELPLTTRLALAAFDAELEPVARKGRAR